MLISLVNIYNLVSFYPYYLSYFNTLIGGIKGAANKGFELTYWGEAMQGRFRT